MSGFWISLFIVLVIVGLILFVALFDSSGHPLNELDVPPGTIEFLKPMPPPYIDCIGCGASHPAKVKNGLWECAYCGRPPGQDDGSKTKANVEVILQLRDMFQVKPPIDRREF